MSVTTVDRIISSDSHVTVKHGQVREHLASKYHDDYNSAVQRFFAEFLGGGAAKANQGAMKFPGRALGRPGTYDPVERMKDMDIDGVHTEVMYCELSAYRYLYMMERGRFEATRAFNDTLRDFSDANPQRLVVSYQIPINDIAFAVEEVQRLAALGAKSLQLPVFPREVGMPDYWEAIYDPLWAAVQETGLPMCFHIGLNTAVDDIAKRDPTPNLALTIPCIPPSTTEALGMWLLTGVLVRFPDLKIVFVESGLGWIVWWLNFVDDMVLCQGYEYPALAELPSYYFKRNVALTFIKEPDTIQHLRHRLGVENLMWSTDYPHPVTSWPDSQAIIRDQFVGVPDEEVALMLAGNAKRVWNL
ncbi:MAG TPA: amidohydrolase family protein [Acidimicrobiales bacterium]|nr:amidohydrolase family protein [Acidimicrobiales bacterium]